MNHWLTDLINLAFPRECHLCESKLVPGEEYVCMSCLTQLPRTGYHRIPMNPMEERFAGIFPFEKATGHFFYNRESELSVLIHDMKYRGFSGIGTLLGRVVAEELYSTGFFTGSDILVPLPMHFLKEAKRGYNQTVHICEGISKITALPVIKGLKMTRPHKTQTKLSKEERIRNSENLFAVTCEKELKNKNVILVHDICTTGSTMTSAAIELSDKIGSGRLKLLSIGVTF